MQILSIFWQIGKAVIFPLVYWLMDIADDYTTIKFLSLFLLDYRFIEADRL